MSDYSFQPQQDPNANVVRYDVQLNNASVEQAISKMQAMADKLANSVGGYSSNVLGASVDATSRMAGAGQPGPGLTPGLFTSSAIPQTMMAAQMAMQGSGAMSPQAAIARDALMMQYNAMGPSSGFGPALTTPWGDPTVNMFRQQSAPHQFNAGFLPVFGPPGAPGDDMHKAGFMRGPGGAGDMASMMIHRALGWGIGNDNLDDAMIRNIERRTEGFGERVAAAGRYGMFNMTGSGLGSWAGGALGTVVGGPVGTVVGGILGGFVGDKIGGSIDATVGRLARPFHDAGADFRQYTAPYIQGDRAGGGLSFRQMLDTQKDLAKRMTSDTWFTANEYADLIKIAGETGVFKMTGTKEQALKAIDTLGESVKALHQMGVQSRNMLKEIDQAVGSFGIDVRNPQQMGAFYATMASTAQTAGLTTSQMTAAAAPAAQLFGSQGLGFKTGAEIFAYHRAGAGALGRHGRFGAMERTYFGDQEGFAQALSQGTAAAFRTPIGEAAIMSMFGGGMDNLRTMLGGGGLSVTDIINGAGSIAADDPERYLGLRARMPWLMQKLPGEAMDRMMINMAMGTFRDTHGGGKIDAEQFLTHLMTAYNQDATSANARITQIAGFGDIARDLRKSTRDQLQIQSMEGLRAPGLRRRFEKLVEGSLGLAAKDLSTGMSKFGHEISKNLEEQFTGVHRYRLGADGAKLGDPFTINNEIAESRRILEEAGLTPIVTTSRQGDAYQQALAENVGDRVGRSSIDAQAFTDAASALGYSNRQAADYRRFAQGGYQVVKSAPSAEAIKGILAQLGGEAKVAQDPGLRETFYARLKERGISRAEGDMVLGTDAAGNAVKSAYKAGGSLFTDADIKALNAAGQKAVLDPLETFQVENQAFVGGISAYRAGQDRKLVAAADELSGTLADSKIGKELIAGLTSDNDANLRLAAKAVFNADLKDLSESQLSTLGGVVESLNRRSYGMDASTRQKGFLSSFAETGQGTKDAEARGYELLEESYRKHMGVIEGAGYTPWGSKSAMYAAMNGTAAETEATAPVVQRLIVGEMMAMSESGADLKNKLEAAGIKAADVGLSEAAIAMMGTDKQGAITQYNAATESALKGLPEHLKSKVDSGRIRREARLDRDQLPKYLQAITGATADQRERGKLMPQIQGKDLTGLQIAVGKDRIGKLSFEDLMTKFNSGDLKDFDEIVQAVSSDDQAAERLGFDRNKLKAFADLSQSLQGGSVDQESIMKVAGLYGASEDAIKQMIADAGPDGAKKVGMQTLQRAFRHNLDTLGMEGAHVKTGVAGSTISRETQAAMIQSFQANMRAASKMEDIMNQFDFSKIQETEKTVDEIVKSMGVSVGDSLSKFEDSSNPGSLKVTITKNNDKPAAATTNGSTYTGTKPSTQSDPKSVETP